MITRCHEPGCTGTYLRHEGVTHIDHGLGVPVWLTGVTVLECDTCGTRSVMGPPLRPYSNAVAMQVCAKRGLLTQAEARFLRKHLGLTAQKLADRLHVSRPLISDGEAGRRPITPHRDFMLRVLVLTEMRQTSQANVEAALERPFAKGPEEEAEPYRVAV